MPATSRVDVQTFLDEHPFSGFQWLIFGLCFVIVLLDGFDTAAIGFIAPSLLKEWGIEKSALGPVLSAALFGLAAGALFSGPLADRLGRKVVLVASVLVFSLACLASAFATNLTELTVLRCVTGIGLGAAMPNAVTLLSEYCPQRLRATMTNLMFCGFPLGAAFGGFLAAWMIPQWGWRSVLTLGGLTPLLLTVALVVILPESVHYLLSRGASVERVRKVMRKISAAALQVSQFVMLEPEHAEVTRRVNASGLGMVLSPVLRAGSLMLWIAYFMGLVIFYALINWMPILFKDAGLNPQTATLISALFPLGGVGAVFFGWLMDRFNANLIIAAGYALTAVSIFFIGQAAGQLGLLMAAVFLGGVMMNTAQSSMPALAAAFYPTQGRATGVSWMLGIGRFGGIAGSFLIAEMTARQLTFSQIFAVMAVPGAIAAVALVVKQFVGPGRSSDKGIGAAVTVH
ncbi:protocatechuate transporter (MFS superfamily) [Bradyrhizobium sp. STM 3843]|uniref:MFS transporter n=1 Tax=Bradyrhizobium sp. STM 3843 TaxID=551947 RepID=UPI000240496E|nr:aromatic acid/H+ symport family MFS transporter [Bradyrhizobium sp. STM 3843]CCE09268.1 protocatechuate transporter (MFS superfamily) [Bradyrhizobium sp. STM 3843]